MHSFKGSTMYKQFTDLGRIKGYADNRFSTLAYIKNRLINLLSKQATCIEYYVSKNLLFRLTVH